MNKDDFIAILLLIGVVLIAFIGWIIIVLYGFLIAIIRYGSIPAVLAYLIYKFFDI